MYVTTIVSTQDILEVPCLSQQILKGSLSPLFLTVKNFFERTITMSLNYLYRYFDIRLD